MINPKILMYVVVETSPEDITIVNPEVFKLESSETDISVTVNGLLDFSIIDYFASLVCTIS